MPDTLDPQQEQVLAGLMLGDGCLYKHKPTHKPHLSISRSMVDIEYLQWTAELFHNFLKRPVQIADYFDSRTGSTYHRASLATRRAEVFEEWHQNWYPNGKKRVPALDLTPLTVAVWFADDGWCGTCPNPRLRTTRLRLKFATHGFPLADVEALALLLTKRYGGRFGVYHDRGCYFLMAADTATRNFIDDIDAVLPPGIERKAIWRHL